MSLTESPGLPQSVQNNEELQLQSLRVKMLASKVTRLLRGSCEASDTSAISWCLHFICGISIFVAPINPEQELALKFTLVKGEEKTSKQTKKKKCRTETTGEVLISWLAACTDTALSQVLPCISPTLFCWISSSPIQSKLLV